MPQDEIIGTIPQALFMMNSPILNRLIVAGRGSQLERVLSENADDSDAVNEVYLLALGRNASAKEVKVCLDYRKEVTRPQRSVRRPVLEFAEFERVPFAAIAAGRHFPQPAHR